MIKSICTTFALTLFTTSISHAAVYNFSYQGEFTHYDSISPSGKFFSYDGKVLGELSYDDVNNTGVISAPSFHTGNGDIEFVPTTLNVVGDGMGNDGPLIQADIEFLYTSHGDVSKGRMEWDATGFFNALASGLPAGVGILGEFAELHGDVLTKAEFILPSPFPTPFDPPPGLNTTTVNIGSSAPGADVLIDSSRPIEFTQPPIGPAPFATTSPFGTISNFFSGPGFAAGYSMLDITDMTLESITPSPVPLPAAFWLFLSGIGTLLGLTRMKR